MSRHLVRRTYRKGKGRVRSGSSKGLKFGRKHKGAAVALLLA